MPAGDAQRTWFPEMVETQRAQWHPLMSIAELIPLQVQLDSMLQSIRSERHILPPFMDAFEGRGHRQCADAVARGARQGCQRALSATIAAATRGTACVLEASAAGALAVLVETWRRVNGWPWESRSSNCMAPERPMPNTFEQFLDVLKK